jgi:hypothetical protein
MLQTISLLLVLAQPPFDDTLKLLRQADSQHARSFQRLQKSFQATRDLFATGPVLSAEELGLHDHDSRTIIEIANLAMLGIWLFEGGLSPCSDAEKHFLSIFHHQMSDLLPDVSDLYVAVKTHHAIEALAAKDADRKSEDLLDTMLDHGVEDRLREQHGTSEFTPQEQILVSSLQSRKSDILAATQQNPDMDALRQRYPSSDLLRAFSTCIKGRLTSISDLGTKLGITIPVLHEVEEAMPNFEDGGEEELDLDDLSSFFEKTTTGLVQNALAELTEETPTSTPVGEVSVEPVDEQAKKDNAAPLTNGKSANMNDYDELAALVAESTNNYVKTTLNGMSPATYTHTMSTNPGEYPRQASALSSLTRTAESMAATPTPYLSHLQQHHPQHSYYSYTQTMPEPQPQPPAAGENLPPNQTCPSAILYDKARQAALSKSSAHTRREGVHSTRRPWTQEEEKALMAGLDMVKGPHWSQILTIFGHNGTISDILKDRTQVQLKDKARNLKLFFLKTNSEMPYYLQAVTGELKTRAPTQAARKEAEERARQNTEEDQAKLQGIMALTGLQHAPQARANGNLNGNATAGQTAVAPAHAGNTAQSTASGIHPSIGPSATGGAAAPSAAAHQKPAGQANTPQMMQSVPQAPPRPQGQLPPHYGRPQGQAQGQMHQQAQPQQQHQARPVQQGQPQQQARTGQQLQQQPRPQHQPLHLPQPLQTHQPQTQHHQQGQQAQQPQQTQPRPQQQAQPQQLHQSPHQPQQQPSYQAQSQQQQSRTASPVTAGVSTPRTQAPTPTMSAGTLNDTPTYASPSQQAATTAQGQAQSRPVGQAQPNHQSASRPSPGQASVAPVAAGQGHVTQAPPASPLAMPQPTDSLMDFEAEAALLKGLQAAVAEASSC